MKSLRLLALVLLLPAAALALDPPPAALLATDSDADGQPDVAEYFTGTNLNLRTDAVKLDSVRRLTGPERIELSWPSISGRAYNVQKSTGLGSWTQVHQTTATSTRTTVTLAMTSATEKKAYYRVTTDYNVAIQPFILSFSTDNSSPLTTAGLVRLTLKTYHPGGISAVDIKDGATVLGQAQARGANEWVFDWQADERNNGAHSFSAVMISGNGVTRTSNAISFTVNVTTPRQHFVLCDTLEISANTVSTVNSTRTFSNNVQFGPFTMTGSTTVTLNLTTQILTGIGPLYGPGGVFITSSPWSFDAARCVLSLTGNLPSPYPLIPGFLTLTPSVVPQFTAIPPGYMEWRGAGTLSGIFPGRSPVNAVSVTGTFWVPGEGPGFIMTCSQQATFGSGITLAAGGVVHLAGVNYISGGLQPLAALTPMTVGGCLHFPAGTGGPAADLDGYMEVKLPVTALDPSLPPQVQGMSVSTGLPVIGSVDPDGSFRPAALPPQPEYLLANLENWIPLGPDCIPIEGGRVIADVLGNLPPCEWRPIVSCAGGRGTISLRFPNGLRMAKIGAESFLQFLHMKLESAPDCPLQFRDNYEIHSPTTLTVGMDVVTVGEILGVLGISASLGLEVTLYGQFDFKLKGGTFSPKGLVGPVLDMAGGILDLLPDPGDTFTGFIWDFQCKEFTDIPCRWPTSLPGGPGGGPNINFDSGAGSPCECHLHMDNDGGLCVYGSAKVTIGSGGATFYAEIYACGDEICMEFLAEDLDFTLTNSWALPVAETIDNSVATTRTALDPIAKALFNKLYAYERRAVAMLRWLDSTLPAGPVPQPDYTEMFRSQGKAALDSFANARLAVPSLATPAEIFTYIKQAGRAARTAPAFDALIEIWMTLERLRVAGIPTAAGSDLQNARAEAQDEINDRLDAGVSISVNTAQKLVGYFVKRGALLAQAGQAEDDAGLATRTGRVIDKAASLLAADLAVTAGALDPVNNPVVRSLPIDEAWGHLESLHDLFLTATQRSIPVSAIARKAELLAQLGRHVESLLVLELDQAKAARNPAAYERALRRYFWLANKVAVGTLGGVAITLAVGPLGIVSLVAAEAFKATGGSFAPDDYIALLRDDAERTANLLQIRSGLPAGASLSNAALTAYYNRTRARIDAAWTNLGSYSAEQLRVLLEAGTQNARLRDALGLGDGTIGWESAQRLSALIDRLVVLAGTKFDVAMLDTMKLAALLLMEEAARFDALSVPNQVKRKFHLLEAEKLAFKLRDLATLLLSRNTARQVLAWPIGVRIDQAAAGFCYNISTRNFTGKASGQFSIPGFSSTFTLKSAVWSSNGSATLNVDAVNLPGFPGTTVALTGSISQGGVWSLSGTATGALPKPPGLPWDINIQSGATVTVSNTGVTVAVNNTAGIVTATGTISVTTGGTATYSGTLQLDTSIFTTGIFTVIPVNGGATKLTLTVNGTATATLNGSKLVIAGPFSATEVPLPDIEVDASYNFTGGSASGITPPAISAALRRYLLNNFQLKVLRAGGLISVSNVSCQLPAAGPLPAISLTGGIASDGNFSFNSSAVTPTFFGFSSSGTFTLSSTPSTPAYQTRLSGLSPEAYWKLDETSGTTAIDSTGHAHTGTHAGGPAINQTGAGYPPANKSYLFNGTSAYVNVPDSDTLDGGTAMSVTAWVKVSSFNPEWQAIIAKGDDTWRLSRYTFSNQISFESNNTGGGANSTVSTTSFNDGQWHHVTAVYDGSTKHLYVDGRLETTSAWSGTISSNDESLQIAANSQAAGRNWNGGLDEIAYFRRALTGSEVRDLYATGIGAALTFSGSISVPGFTGAAFSVNGKISQDNSWSLTGTPALLTSGGFSLSAAGGGLPSLTIGNTGIRVPGARLSFGALFLPLDLPAFTIPSSGDFSVEFDPVALNLRGFSFPDPSLVFRRSAGVTALDCTGLSLSLPGLPSIPFGNRTISSSNLAFSSGNLSRNFFGFDASGGFDFGSPSQDSLARMNSLAPEAWWKLDESDADAFAVYDASLHAHQGTVTGFAAVGVNGGLYPLPGRSYDFSGIGYIAVPDADMLEGGSAMSLTAWIKVSAFTVGWQSIVAKGDNTWRLSRYADTNQISFESNNPSGGADSTISTSSVNDGQWHHVAAVFDGSTKFLYIDGRLENSRTWAGPIANNTAQVWIGGNSDYPSRLWRGGLDEVAFFRRGLTANEVRDLYAAGNGLRFSFTGSVNLDDTIQTSLSGAISSGGGFEFTGGLSNNRNFRGFPFLSAGSSFTFAHTETNSTSFSGAMNLGVIPTPFGSRALESGLRFAGSFTRSGTVTTASLTVNDTAVNLGGYKPKSPGFDLSLTGDAEINGSMTFSDFRFGPFGTSEITDIGLPALNGTISTAGNLSAGNAFQAPLTLRNLTAPSTFISFNNNGLNVTGEFDLDITINNFTRDLGDATVTGVITPGGSYSLVGGAIITLAGDILEDAPDSGQFPVKFQSPDIGSTLVPWNATPVLHWGEANISINNFVLNQNGFGYSMSKSGDTDWVTKVRDVFNNALMDDRLTWKVNFNYNIGSNTISAGMDGTATWSWRTSTSPPNPPDPDGPEGPLPDPPTPPDSGNITATGGINSNGDFNFTPPNLVFWGVSNFSFNLWD